MADDQWAGLTDTPQTSSSPKKRKNKEDQLPVKRKTHLMEGSPMEGVRKYFIFIKKRVSSDWRDLAFCLGFERGDIRNIAGRNQDDKSRCMDLLEEWLERNGERATIEVMMKALSDIELKSTVDGLKKRYPELSLCCSDAVLPVKLHLAQQMPAGDIDVGKQVQARILELERTLFTVDVFRDPELYKRTQELFLAHLAILQQIKGGSVILLLTFLRQTDVDRFYHNYYRVGEGTLSQQLSHILISDELRDKVKGAQLIVRLQVKHEDYVRVWNRLGQGLDRTTSVDNLLALSPPSRQVDHSSLRALDLALVSREDRLCSDGTDDGSTLNFTAKQVQTVVKTGRKKSERQARQLQQLQIQQKQMQTAREDTEAMVRSLSKEVTRLTEQKGTAEKILGEHKLEIQQLQEANKSMAATIEELMSAKPGKPSEPEDKPEAANKATKGDQTEKELRKLFFRFSRNVTETHEVEDLGGALGLIANEMTSIQALRNQTPSSQAYNVLLKWMETEREVSMDKLQQELSDLGMDGLAEEAGRIKAQPAKQSADTSGGPLTKRPADTSGGPPAKRPADTLGGPPAKQPAAGGSRQGHQEEQQSKDEMAQVLQENHRLRALVEELQGNKKPRRQGPGDKPVVLLLNDEYGTAKGGVSTIHCQMTGLLASKGAKVYSTVLSATQQDKDDAAADGVQLIFPTISERDKREPCLDWLTFEHTTRYPDLPLHVDFIVGHVPVTSHAARQIKERFPDAKVIQVTHVMPEDTSHYKSEEKVLSIGEENDNILDDLRHADVIFSVGPLMYDYYTMQTRQLKPHYEFLPKPSDIFRETEVTYVDTETKTVLTVGRFKGVERLKGYDLSAKAMSMVIDHLPHAKWRGRGVSAEDFPESKAIIEANVKKGKFHFTPLKYGTQRELREDMQKASVVLMPSRAEPFGLVGLEAIAAGVPVLVSHKSGLAWFLKTQGYEFDRTIVEIEDDDDEAAQTLAKRIIKILKDGRREFQAAQSLKKKLLESNYWAASHTKFLETFGLKG
ncbi:Hypp8710 [Branchiostoma lanceolatum]|uniref:Hypp8710 protein n=1 Tax=Branchiostoma lanceolatum TaxID=7740 RepID=A0A8K0EGC6_BRALA|nr:Hypp8710 [Branchiostoma lanceolatum]